MAGSLGQLADILSHPQEEPVWEISTNLGLVYLEGSPHVNTHRPRAAAWDCKLRGPGDKGPKVLMPSLPQSLLLNMLSGMPGPSGQEEIPEQGKSHPQLSSPGWGTFAQSGRAEGHA